jgi:hypothetical protein
MEANDDTPSQGSSLDSQESAGILSEFTDQKHDGLKTSLIYFTSQGEEDTAVLGSDAAPVLGTAVEESCEEVDGMSLAEDVQTASGQEVRTAEVHEEADVLPTAIAPIQDFKAGKCIADVDAVPPEAEVKPPHEIKTTLSEEHKVQLSHEELPQPKLPVDNPLQGFPHPLTAQPADPPLKGQPHQLQEATKASSHQETPPTIPLAMRPGNRTEKEVTQQAESGPVSKTGDCVFGKQAISTRVPEPGVGLCARCSFQ